MEIKQLEYMVACTECGSYGKASEILYTTQANISKVISKLEDELGFKLFERSSTGVNLTPGGRKVYEAAQEILEKAESICYGHRDDLDSKLSIASVYDTELSRQYSNFVVKKTFSGARINFNIGKTEEVLDYVASERADIGLLYLDNLHRNSLTYLLHKKQLEFESIAKADLYLSVGKLNGLYDCEELNNKTLREQEYVCFEDDLIFKKNFHIDILMKEFDIKENIERAIYTNSETFLTSVIIETNRAYLHYAYCSESSISHPIRNLKIQCKDNSVIWGYVKKKGRETSALQKEFINSIKTDKQPLNIE